MGSEFDTMHPRKKKQQTIEDLVIKLTIVQLGLAGVGQHDIRKIVGGDIRRINGIVRHLKKIKKKS
jgi:hypothetical protein